MNPRLLRCLPASILLALLAAAAAAQSEQAPLTSEDVARAYANRTAFWLDQARRDGADAPGADEIARWRDTTLTVTLYECAPKSGDVGQICTYRYSAANDRAGVNFGSAPIVRAHLFEGPNGLLVRELEPPSTVGATDGAEPD